MPIKSSYPLTIWVFSILSKWHALIAFPNVKPNQVIPGCRCLYEDKERPNNDERDESEGDSNDDVDDEDDFEERDNIENVTEKVQNDILYKVELFDELQQDLIEARAETNRMTEQLENGNEEMLAVVLERDTLKRQLEDLQV